jgi:hypothetical protein
MTSILQHQNQLIQLSRLNPAEAKRAYRALESGLEKSAIKIITDAMKAQLKPTIPDDPARWPQTLGESVECLLGQNYEANRQERQAPKRILKPDSQQAQRALELALKPGGGGPLHRPRYQFGR